MTPPEVILGMLKKVHENPETDFTYSSEELTDYQNFQNVFMQHKELMISLISYLRLKGDMSRKESGNKSIQPEYVFRAIFIDASIACEIRRYLSVHLEGCQISEIQTHLKDRNYQEEFITSQRLRSLLEKDTEINKAHYDNPYNSNASCYYYYLKCNENFVKEFAALREAKFEQAEARKHQRHEQDAEKRRLNRLQKIQNKSKE